MKFVHPRKTTYLRAEFRKNIRWQQSSYERGHNIIIRVQLAKEYEAQGKVLIIAPDDACGVDTLTKDREALRKFYEKGYRDAYAIPGFLQ